MPQQFQPFPYLAIQYAVQPQAAQPDLDQLIRRLVHDDQSAAFLLQRLATSCRKAGLQIFLHIENPEMALPEAHRLTTAIFALPQSDGIYYTPPASNYDKAKLFGLLNLNQNRPECCF